MVRPILPSITGPYVTLSLSLIGFPSGPDSGVSAGPAVISTSYSPGSKGDTKGNFPLQRPSPDGANSTTLATRSPAFTIWGPALTRVPIRSFPLKAGSPNRDGEGNLREPGSPHLRGEFDRRHRDRCGQ